MQRRIPENEQELIRRVLVRQGPQSLHGLAQHVGELPRRIRKQLDDLTGMDRIHAACVGRSVRYVWKTSAIRDCDCDGTCLEQLVALFDERCQKLLGLLGGGVRIHTAQLVERAERRLGWSGRTTYRWLKHLVEVDLIEVTGPCEGDRRSRFYRQKNPHPTVVLCLSE